MKTVALIIFLVILTPILAPAQDIPGIIDELAPQPFYVDYAAFADTLPNSVVIEVFYKIFSTSLTFEKWGEKFKADYIVDIIIEHKGKQITGSSHDGSLVADTYKNTLSKTDFIINKVVFHLPPENYELTARLKDSKTDDIVRPIETEIKLRDFGKKQPYISNIEFIRNAAVIENDSDFVRNGMRLIPSVSRLYGDEEPSLKFYYEIYNVPEFSGEYLAIYEISDGSELVFSDTALFPSNGTFTSRLENIGVDSLLPGDYKLALNIQSPGHKIELKSHEEFYIGWSVLGLVKNDFKTAVEQLRYIATREQMKLISASSSDEHIKRWEDFWKAKDPTPSTPENELKDEYYKRVRYSDLNFGHFGRDGWKTDMGMVYITYGPPDEIERHPFDLEAKPYQIWFYYGLKLVFRFVDFNGYGEYELIYPYDGDMRKIR